MMADRITTALWVVLIFAGVFAFFEITKPTCLRGERAVIERNGGWVCARDR